MELFAQIKLETANIHRGMMEQDWAKRILASDYTLAEYRCLLQKLYGFYLPLETQLLKLKVPYYQKGRIKHELLHRDLAYLNCVTSENKICTQIPRVTDTFTTYGICYVLEGSTLGGQVICCHLTKSLGLYSAQGKTFFNCYGAQTLNKFETFKSEIGELVHTDKEREAVLEGALSTFYRFFEWMEAE